jgi:hypothetical protein
MNRFAILAAFVFLCAFNASPLKAEEPSSAAPAAATAPVPAATEKATEKKEKKMPALVKNMMKNLPEPMAKAIEDFKPEDMKSVIDGLCPDGKCNFGKPAK